MVTLGTTGFFSKSNKKEFRKLQLPEVAGHHGREEEATGCTRGSRPWELTGVGSTRAWDLDRALLRGEPSAEAHVQTVSEPPAAAPMDATCATSMRSRHNHGCTTQIIQGKFSIHCT